jgi:hypothetical protein
MPSLAPRWPIAACANDRACADSGLARERGELIRAREEAEAQWLLASEAYEAQAQVGPGG